MLVPSYLALISVFTLRFSKRGAACAVWGGTRVGVSGAAVPGRRTFASMVVFILFNSCTVELIGL